MKHAGELWKNNDCQSCLCPRGSGGEIECYSQTCDQQLSCSNPVLKKGQCCPFCLPPTAAIAVCIFNYIQYRSGEHWNVSFDILFLLILKSFFRLVNVIIVNVHLEQLSVINKNVLY
jgi:hypothetical protein